MASQATKGSGQVAVSRSDDDGITWHEAVVPNIGPVPFEDARLDFVTPTRGWMLARIGLTDTGTLLATTDAGVT